MSSPALGVNAQAAFRLNSRVAAAAVWPASGFPLTMPKATPYDRIALLKHSIKENANFDMDEALTGNAGYQRMDRISRMPGGSLELNAGYLGLDQIIAAALGMEKFRDAAIESPVFGFAGTGAAITGTGAAAGSTTVTLTATGTPFTNNSIIGDWVRIGELTTTPHLYDDVRKIVGWTSTSVITVAPAWTTIPHSKPFSVAREFLHTYEVSRNLHGELFSEILAGAWATGVSTSFLTRNGVLVFYNGFGYEELQCSMIKKLSLKWAPDSGLTVSADVVSLYLDFTNQSVQSKDVWDFTNGTGTVPASGTSFMVYERVLFPDLTFRLNPFSTSTPLSASHNLAIKEFEISIENPLDDSAQTTVSGVNRAEPQRSGKRKIEGSFTLRNRTDNNLVNYFRGENDLMASATCVGSPIIGAKTNELTAWMRRLRLKTPDHSIGGPNVVPEKHEFTLLQCDAVTGAPNGMPTPTTGLESGELIIQTRNQNPFNAFMNQNKE